MFKKKAKKKKNGMLDLITIALTVVVALAYTWATKSKQRNDPNTTQGPPDHADMPEMEYVFPMEASELNASSYAGAGRAYQVGAFGFN